MFLKSLVDFRATFSLMINALLFLIFIPILHIKNLSFVKFLISDSKDHEINLLLPEDSICKQFRIKKSYHIYQRCNHNQLRHISENNNNGGELLVSTIMLIRAYSKVLLLVGHSNLNIANKSVRPFLFTILNNSLYRM